MVKLFAVPKSAEIVHAAVVTVGVFVLSYISMEHLNLQGEWGDLTSLVPLFVFFTAGILMWDRLVHDVMK